MRGAAARGGTPCAQVKEPKGKSIRLKPSRSSSQLRIPTSKAAALKLIPARKVKFLPQPNPVVKSTPMPSIVCDDARDDERAIEAWSLASKMGVTWAGDSSEIINQLKDAACGFGCFEIQDPP